MAGVMLLSPTLAHADSTTRTLVYNFTYSVDNLNSQGASDTGTENLNYMSGPMDMMYHGAASDAKGTITVQVTGTQPDGGLILSVAMQGGNTGNGPPATCVVYGNTRTICDPNKEVYSQEYALLRFLGPKFVDPNQLDANKHWRVTQDQPNQSMQADYTINGNSAGTMQIGETRKIQEGSARKLTTNVETKIAYDFNRSLPTTIDEYVTQRVDNGIRGTSKTTYQTTLQLVSDTTPKV
jgi:hypothetical protein